jgi:hypothetical protein
MGTRDIMHRDLKPQNILVFDNYNIKITDFGLARPTACIYSKGFTKEVYTLWYRPIEVLAPDIEGYETSADIWSIGCVIYELYTNKPLFKAMNWKDMVLVIWVRLGNQELEQVEDVESIGSNVLNTLLENNLYEGNIYKIINEMRNQSMANLVLECLQYDPDKRPTAYKLLRNSYFNDIRDESLESKPQSCYNSFFQREWYPKNNLVNQPDLHAKELQILTDWLINVHRMFKLSDRTLFVGQFLIDWALSKRLFNRLELQLLGATCQLIASKFCEIYSPEVNDYVYVAGGAFQSSQVLELERELIQLFNYDLVFSVSSDFYKMEQSKHANKWNKINRLILMVILMLQLRFLLLPSEQYKLSSIVTEAIIDHKYVIPQKWIDFALQIKLFVQTTKLTAINNYGTKLGISIRDEIDNLIV